jgi:hypothetical protein
MKKTIKAFYLLLAAMLATGCIVEMVRFGQPPVPEGDDVELVLRLSTPGSFAPPSTRGLSFVQEDRKSVV